MYRQTALLFVAALLGLAHAQQPQVTAPPGPQFTGDPGRVVKRQDNEERDIEIHRAYGAPIGVDTNYLTMEGSTTKVCYSRTPVVLNSWPFPCAKLLRYTANWGIR